MSYSSGEFAVPVAWTSAVAPAAAVFNGNLWVVGGDSGRLSQATLSLVKKGSAIAIENGDAKLADNWRTGPLAGPDGNPLKTPAGSAAACSSSPAMAAVGDALVLCWNDTSGALLLSQYKVGDNGSLGWQPPVLLAAAGDPDGGGLAAAVGAEVGLIALDPWTLLIVCPRTSAWWANGGQTLFIGTFNINDIGPRQTPWKARTDIWGGPKIKAPFGDPDFDYPMFGTRVGVDWFTVATQTKDANIPSGKTPTLQLWLTLAPESSLSATSLIAIDSVAGQNGVIQSYEIGYSDARGWTAPSGAGVRRDPAGRICSLARPADGYVDVSAYSTWSVPAPGPEPLPRKDLPKITAPSIGTIAPTLAFFTDTTETTNDCPPENPNHTRLAYAVYRFAFYGDTSGRQYCQVDRYGTAEVYPDYGALAPEKPKPPYLSDMIVVQGIVDGPIPVPAVNFADFEFTPGETEFAELEYGHVDETHTERSFSNSWTVGFKSEGEASKGFGPAWDVSLKGGMGSIRRDGTATQKLSMRTKKSLLDEHSKRPNQTVDPRGTAFGRKVHFHWTAYRFLDASCAAVADGTNAAKPQQAPLFTTVSTQYVDGGGKDFVPYAVRPGDLSSYTKEAINKRMQDLGYPGKDYFAEVIAPNAYKFAGDSNCIEVTWTAGGGQTTETFSQTTEHFTESSWSLDSEVYAGISGGGGVDIFNIDIEEFSFKLLAGVTFSCESTSSVDESHEWSIGLGSNWGGFGGGVGKTIADYTFQIYFLPPPSPSDIFKGKAWPAMGANYWVKELQLCAPKAKVSSPYEQIDPLGIDPNSGAWRIFFIVDSYESGDRTVHYP